MENYLKTIKKKLTDKVVLEKLEIINNSNKHKGHKFFSKAKNLYKNQMFLIHSREGLNYAQHCLCH